VWWPYVVHIQLPDPEFYHGIDAWHFRATDLRLLRRRSALRTGDLKPRVCGSASRTSQEHAGYLAALIVLHLQVVSWRIYQIDSAITLSRHKVVSVTDSSRCSLVATSRRERRQHIRTTPPRTSKLQL
jgi:hypothetical protein